LNRLLALLGTPPGARVFNPWRDHDPSTDRDADAPRQRLARLREHLDCDARLILVGEAAGYQGCHVSGIAFTSERLLLEGRIPRVRLDDRITSRPRPWSEPSATTVWGTLHELGLAESTVLWNCFPWHPHREGELQSNRTPTREEIAAGRPLLDLLCSQWPKAKVIAVGKAAAGALAMLDREAPCVRHPSMGGATEFRAGLRRCANRPGKQTRL